MVILQLMIAHLLGDFVFQSNKLITEKYKRWTGTFKHALIITLFTAVALLPYWNQVATLKALLVIGCFHFVQDVAKVELDKHYNPKNSSVPFFVDQFMHLSLIILVGRNFGFASMTLPDWYLGLYYSPLINALLVTLIVITFTFDITRYQFKRQKNLKLKYHPDHKGMLQRVLAFSLVYFLFLLVHGLFLSA